LFDPEFEFILKQFDEKIKNAVEQIMNKNDHIY